MTPLVVIDRSGAVPVIVLNRPERHNSLVPELLEDLLAALDEVRSAPAVVLAAEGRTFSTGGDVKAFAAQGDDLAAYANRVVGLLNEAMMAMIDLPAPIVAAVHGIVTGGSIGLVLASDVVLVAPEASFTPWYGPVGFAPDGGWTALLPDVIGRARAADVLLRNCTINAEQAVAWGLAAAVAPAGVIRRQAASVAAEIAGMVPGAVRHTKAGLWRDRDRIAAALEDERRRFVEQIVTPEARDGMARFLAR